MSFIQNVSYEAIVAGKHRDPGENSILIQIQDPGWSFPYPRYQFKEVYKFSFFDATDEIKFKCITDNEAKQIVEILQRAFANGINVISHCAAGICRSGAITEVGVMLGFEDAKSIRIPNTLVKRKLMKELGWTYDSTIDDQFEMTAGGVISAMKDYF